MKHSAHADTETTELIDDIRRWVRSLDYEPLDDEANARIDAQTEDAVVDGEFEGVFRTPRIKALHVMLFEERAPCEVRTQATERFMKAIAAEGRQ